MNVTPGTIVRTVQNEELADYTKWHPEFLHRFAVVIDDTHLCINGRIIKNFVRKDIEDGMLEIILT